MSLVEVANGITVERITPIDVIEVPKDLAVVVASGWVVPTAMHDMRDAQEELKAMEYDHTNFGSISWENLDKVLAFLAQFYEVEQSIKDAMEHHAVVWVNAYNAVENEYHVYEGQSVLDMLKKDREHITVNWLIHLREVFPLSTYGFSKYYGHATKTLTGRDGDM